jgi:excisionase family DNA binding protein
MSANGDGAVPVRSLTVGGFEPYVNIEEAAGFLAVPVSWLYEQCRLGKVPSRKVGKYRRFRLSELETWVTSK